MEVYLFTFRVIVVIIIDIYSFYFQPDMERGVHGRFLDPSTSVREAAIELVGKFILIRPELIPQYYNMLSERILVSFILYIPFKKVQKEIVYYWCQTVLTFHVKNFRLANKYHACYAV